MWWPLRAIHTYQKPVASREGEYWNLRVLSCQYADAIMSYKKTKDWINDFGNYLSFPFFLQINDF